MTPAELARFTAKYDILPDGCWRWKAAVTKPSLTSPNSGGYGITRADGRTRLAHRVSYEHHNGPVPEGMTLDHVCHKADGSCPGGLGCLHRRCVNPAHLKAVTQKANNKRGLSVTAANDEKTECPAKHPYDEANTYVDKTGRRHCRTCRRARTQRWYDQRGGAAWHRDYHQTVRKQGS